MYEERTTIPNTNVTIALLDRAIAINGHVVATYVGVNVARERYDILVDAFLQQQIVPDETGEEDQQP